MNINEKINKLIDNEVSEVEGWNFIKSKNRLVINDSDVMVIGRIKSRVDNNRMLLNVNSTLSRDASKNQWVLTINQGV